jgi:hypothetical protein
MVDAGHGEVPPQLPQLQLEADPHQVLSAGGLVGMDPGLLCGISSDLMAGERLVVRGAKRPFAALEWALMLLPAGLRSKMAVSAGIRVSPSRPVQIAWVEPDAGETDRAIIGQSIRLVDLEKASLAADPAPREYFALLRRWWTERRWDEICLLTGALTGRSGSVELVRVATICQAIDDAATADAERLAQYQGTCQRLKAGSDVERDLVDRLGQVIETRQRALEREGFAKRGDAASTTVLPRAAKVGG